MKKQTGFTLIEMMLVIAVIAIMSALAVTTYRRQAQTARIDKVSIEMQHILEAALAFNVDNNGKWPDPNKGTACSTQQPSDAFVDNYIPNQDVHSSFGGYYCWSKLGGSNGDSRLFWVALKVPHNNRVLAKRIAARLPNAIATTELEAPQPASCSGGDCYVRTEVVQPGVSSNNNSQGGMVVATGDCPSHNDDTNSNENSSTCRRISSDEGTKYRINFTACPENALPRVTVFPNFINFPEGNFPGFTIKNMDAKRTSDACTIRVGDNDQRRQQCDISIHATTCVYKGSLYDCKYLDIANTRHPGSMGASYIVACVPPTKLIKER